MTHERIQSHLAGPPGTSDKEKEGDHMYGVEGGVLRYKLNAVALLFKSFKLAIIQGVFTFRALTTEWKSGLSVDVTRVVLQCMILMCSGLCLHAPIRQGEPHILAIVSGRPKVSQPLCTKSLARVEDQTGAE